MIDMPALTPNLRKSVLKLVPSSRSEDFKVAKVMVLSGMNTKPVPKPCMMPFMTTTIDGVSSVHVLS